MTARLPTPGADDGAWGDILNAFLSVGHDASGSNLSNVQNVTTGGSNSTFALPSAVTAGAGATQVIRKADVGAGRVVVSDGVSDRAWLSNQGDIVAFWSDGSAWTAIGWNIQPITDTFGGPSSSGTFTWTKAPLAQYVDILTIGAGGGGGGGRRSATSAIRSGGTGGSPGQINRNRLPAYLVGATESVTVQAGGGGGAAVTADSTNGNNGSPATPATPSGLAYTSFGNWVAAASGFGGLGGLNANTGGNTAIQGLSNSGMAFGGNGTSSTADASVLPTPQQAGAGGPASIVDASNNVRAPGPGNDGSALSGIAYHVTGGTKGSSGTPAGGGGGNATDLRYQTGGSGGGGAYYVTSAAGANGGNGGWPGGAGGGGAPADNGNNSGAGGNGANGAVSVTQYF